MKCKLDVKANAKKIKKKCFILKRKKTYKKRRYFGTEYNKRLFIKWSF